MDPEIRLDCLGPDGSVAHVSRVLRSISGRWKLHILFRLFAEPTMRNAQLLKDIPNISQKMLTQHLRELENDGLVARRDFDERPPRVEYELTRSGRALTPVLISVRGNSPACISRTGTGLQIDRACRSGAPSRGARRWHQMPAYHW
ncbi:ArsR family transcriptional regulator [Acuticoccus sediminis]|uniref:ArsR family transcriptional regulator n=2 Tax=Acuticoccus sediminis TaxID=2184697 RepID=A0A8B2NHI8_9HYPH|nr:ArsR family transcriptional regulator [Acuticoccus sediminis]